MSPEQEAAAMVRSEDVQECVREQLLSDKAVEALAWRIHGHMPFDTSVADEEREDTIAFREATTLAREQLEAVAADLFTASQPPAGGDLQGLSEIKAFCEGSAAEYGRGTPEHGAYTNVLTFLRNLADRSVGGGEGKSWPCDACEGTGSWNDWNGEEGGGGVCAKCDGSGRLAPMPGASSGLREAEPPGDDVITVYRHMKAAVDGARAERDIMRVAVEAIAGGWKSAQDRAHRALEEDRKRRERNLAALRSQQPVVEEGDRG